MTIMSTWETANWYEKIMSENNNITIIEAYGQMEAFL